MRQEVWIPGPLPGLNEIVEAAKGAGGTGRAYSRMKQAWTQAVALHARAARLKPVPAARFTFTWREKSRQRNPDNIAAARKFVMDGLVVAKVLTNDGWSEVLGWTDVFDVASPVGVLVVLET